MTIIENAPSNPQNALRMCNNVLTVVIVLLGLYIIAAPFLPQVSWWLKPEIHTPSAIAIRTPTKDSSEPIPSENLLRIPRLAMREVIHTGPYPSELRKGVWKIPSTSTPDKQANTVIIGHRFTYAGQAVFYFLDKVQVGDQIIIDWEHTEYTYAIKEIRVVPPTAVEIQQPTKAPTLTLYTCTPLTTAKNRLVLIAPLVRVRS